jgi:hypothetical protein
MKIKWLNPLMLTCLSTAFVALGFGSCKSQSNISKQQRAELKGKMAKIQQEIDDNHATLAKMRSDYENIGRGECVYGGPNMMKEAVSRMKERQDNQRSYARKKMDEVQQAIDSLNRERDKVATELEQLDKKK